MILQRRVTAAVCVAGFAIALSATCAAYSGRVIYADTGKPASGVYVIATWEAGGGLGSSTSGCSIATARANATGEFSVSRPATSLVGILGRRDKPTVFFYARGYANTTVVPAEGQPYVIVSDSASPLARLERLDQLVFWTECGIDERIRRRYELAPLYEAIAEEAAGIVRDNPDHPEYESWLRYLRWQVRMIQLNSREAVEKEARKGWK